MAASHARQADDDSLHKTAVRIQARTVRRCGELLKQFNGRGANHHGEGAPSMLSQRQAAERADISKDQQVQAVRVANVPAADFDAQIESDAPPTITVLAEQATEHREAQTKKCPWDDT